ncbi:hypothetical protein PsYK624_120080 [Phanerochaete sordida]|uniref:Uncharacterized protein n=1 Tax=Phanerochaete sordida TaxID=48140 RepID=A0A9P3LI72_9APHY|nr:hypothetical protein PsYK624_120080 [Phanerochaete sordida]
MPSRSPPSIPLIRKPRFPGSPSIRDVKPEHKYLVHANRRLRTQEIATKLFKLKFEKERAEERDCREKMQEEVVDYRGTGQSPKRKAVGSTIRKLTRSLCSLPRRAKQSQIFVSFDEAMDIDTDENGSTGSDDTSSDLEMDCDFEMVDLSYDADEDIEMEDAVTPATFPIFPSLVYTPFVPPPPPPQQQPQFTTPQHVQPMSALNMPTPPPPYVPAPAPAMPAPTPAPFFPPGLHVPAAQASEADMAEEAAPSGAASVANGAASKGKAAQDPEQGLSEATSAAPAKETSAGSTGKETERKGTTKSGRLRRMRRGNKDRGL